MSPQRLSIAAPNGAGSADDTDLAEGVSLLRAVLDDVLLDRRFLSQTSISAFELAEHILTLTSHGERDIARLKDFAFRKLQPEN
jgi:hypothetical protein